MLSYLSSLKLGIVQAKCSDIKRPRRGPMLMATKLEQNWFDPQRDLI